MKYRIFALASVAALALTAAPVTASAADSASPIVYAAADHPSLELADFTLGANKLESFRLPAQSSTAVRHNVSYVYVRPFYKANEPLMTFAVIRLLGNYANYGVTADVGLWRNASDSTKTARAPVNHASFWASIGDVATHGTHPAHGGAGIRLIAPFG